MYRKKLPLTDLDEPLKSVLRYWRANGGEQLALPWTRFKLYELPPRVLPTTLVIDVFDDMDKNRVRYWGSKMTEIHGSDMTGKSPYDMSPAEFAQTLRSQHREIRNNRVATADILGFLHERGFEHSHSVLRMPLSNDGQTVDHIVGVIWYTPSALETLARDADNNDLRRG